MTIAVRGAATLVAAVALASCSAQAQPSSAVANVMHQLKTEMTGRVEIDGSLIRDVQPAGDCRSSFTTTRGRSVIDWRKVNNPTGRLAGGRKTITYDDGASVHRLSMPVGHLAENVTASTDVLVGECQAH